MCELQQRRNDPEINVIEHRKMTGAEPGKPFRIALGVVRCLWAGIEIRCRGCKEWEKLRRGHASKRARDARPRYPYPARLKY